MAECNVNINKLPEVGEVKSGDLIIIENADGTQAVDFKNFVITQDNINFANSILTNTQGITANYALIQALSGALANLVGWESMGMTWKGECDSTKSYQKGDAVFVTALGRSFVADCAIPAGVECGDTKYWDPLVLSPEAGLPLSRKGELLTHDGVHPCGDIITLSAGPVGTVLTSQGTDNELIWSEFPGTDNCKSLAKGLHTGNHYFADSIMLYHMSNSTIMSVGASNNYGTAYGNWDTGGGQAYNRPQLAGIDRYYDPVNDPITAVYQTGMETQFFITSGGNVWGAGFNDGTHGGYLGTGDTTNREIFERNEYFYDNNIAVADIVSNGSIRNDEKYKTVFFLTTGGDVYSCGYNGNGNCGIGTTSNAVTTPSKIDLPNIEKVYTGGYSATTFAVTTGGDVYGWGHNGNGQLGNGETSQRAAPQLLSPNYAPMGIADIKVFDMDYYNGSAYSSNVPAATFILTLDGTMHFAGAMQSGIAGIGSFAVTNMTTFSAVSADVINDIVQFEVNPQYNPHVVAVDSTGNCFAWGDNTAGQLCLSDQIVTKTGAQSSPVNLSTSLSSSFDGSDIRGKVSKVLVGSPSIRNDANYIQNTYFQDTDGQLYACGRNSYASIPLQGTGNTWNVQGKLVKIPLPCKPSEIAEWKILHLGNGGYTHWYSSELVIRTKDGRVFLAGSDAAEAAWGDGGTNDDFSNYGHRDHWVKVAF